NQRFGNTAGDRLNSEFLVAQKTEGLDQTGDCAQQTEQRRERHERIHNHQESSGAFDLDARGNLQRGFERAVLMVETIPKHSQYRVAGTARKPRGLGSVTVFNCRENFLDPFRIAAEPAATPPNASLEYNGERY